MKVYMVKLLCTALLSITVKGLDLYISPGKSDGGTGSKYQPLRTLSQAQDAVRTRLTSTITEDINVLVAPGVYSLLAPLVFAAVDSGNNGFKFNWVGTDAVVLGGLKVTGWTKGANDIYLAIIPAGTKSRNLYVNGIASNYALHKINYEDFNYTSTGMTWISGSYDLALEHGRSCRC
ncbi:hypothetical protein GQ53DRAFT_834921 [Thozetella sp. PMI_491]|nr:hypothetical protein GQ53DRAFT_834921 [Thozetella sp. PMI_491]